jgi:hypothetical protein
MTLETLTDQLKLLLSDDIPYIDCTTTTPLKLNNLLNELGVEDLMDDFDSNGWQHDF